MSEFFGKYRGEVVSNEDPLKLGRVRVKVPSVLGAEESWAMPAVPYAGPNVGFFMIPPERAHVWVEFECGELDYPIWTGCFWLDANEVPVESSDQHERPQFKVLKTHVGTITLSDKDDSLTIETTAGMKIVLDSSGIEIDNGHDGTIKFSGQGKKIRINGDALEIE